MPPSRLPSTHTQVNMTSHSGANTTHNRSHCHNGCRNCSDSPHRRRARIVQSHSPGGAHMYPYLMHGSLGQHELLTPPKRHLDWFSRFCRTHPYHDQQTHRETSHKPRYVKACMHRNSLYLALRWCWPCGLITYTSKCRTGVWAITDEFRTKA